MTETPVGKLITSLAIPTIISMLVTSIYNMADTYFVSKLGESASGAVGIVFSLMAIIQAVGFTLGMGSGSWISRLWASIKTVLQAGSRQAAFMRLFYSAYSYPLSDLFSPTRLCSFSAQPIQFCPLREIMQDIFSRRLP